MTTSNGLLPKVLKHAALVPPNKPIKGVVGLLPINCAYTLVLVQPALVLNATVEPNRIQAFVMDPKRIGTNPLYKEMTPVVLTVYVRPEIMPVYGNFAPLVFDWSWRWLLMYLIGQMAAASDTASQHGQPRIAALSHYAADAWIWYEVMH